MCICARTTTTRIRRHADKEHKKQDQQPRRQANLCMLVYCFSLFLRAFLCLHIQVSMCARVSMHGLTTRGCSHVTAISCCTWYCVRVVPAVHTGTPSIGIVQLRPGGLNPLHVATQEYKKPSIIMYAPSAKFCPRKKINYGHFQISKKFKLLRSLRCVPGMK